MTQQGLFGGGGGSMKKPRADCGKLLGRVSWAMGCQIQTTAWFSLKHRLNPQNLGPLSSVSGRSNPVPTQLLEVDLECPVGSIGVRGKWEGGGCRTVDAQ